MRLGIGKLAKSMSPVNVNTGRQVRLDVGEHLKDPRQVEN